MNESLKKMKINDPVLFAALITNALEMFRLRKAYLEIQCDETTSQEELNISQTNWDLYLDTYCKAMRIFDKTVH